MQRPRTNHNERVYALPDDFQQRQVWSRHASGLTWAEIARRLGIDLITIRRGGRPGCGPTISI